MVSDLREGPGGTGVRAGIIGEIGVDALSDQERKVLQASAEAQRQTGAAINVHVEFIMGGAAAGRWAEMSSPTQGPTFRESSSVTKTRATQTAPIRRNYSPPGS